jgi:multidrug efflux pump
VNLSRPFIRRPIATTLLATALLLSGLVGYRQLPVAPLPQVDLPTINVQGVLPGASPETMASSVATPLERRLGRIAGVSEMTSVSTLGNTSLTLQFDLGRDVDAAARDVQAAINASSGDLPPNLPARPNYRKVNPSDSPILILSLTSDVLPIGQVFDAGSTILAQKISQVPGVGQVFVGGALPAVRVQADPAALAGLGLTLEDLRGALATATVNQAKGSLSDEHELRTVASNDQLLSAAGYPPLVIAWRNGAPIRLSDVARAVDSVENVRFASWADQKPGVVVIIRRQPGANIIDVIDRVRALLPTLAHSIPRSIDITVAMDRSASIRASIGEVRWTLIFSTVLVVLVVFVFLRSARLTLIPSVVVPLSIVGTFGVMALAGFSIDNLSLMALTISTGFVVDDAIVVTENVTRHLEEGTDPRTAALDGARQIGFTILSITISLLAVFIPLLLMRGIVGRLLREFAMTLGIAIALSAAISLTLTPMMCALLARPRRKTTRPPRFGDLFGRITRGYGRALRWVIDHEPVALIATLAAIGITIFLYVVTPKGLFPQQDTGLVLGFADAPQDISFPALKSRMETLNAIVGADPAVDHFVAFIGGGFGAAGNTGTAFVQLKPLGQRDARADQIIGRLRRKLTTAPGIMLYLQSIQDLRVGGRLTRTQYQYTLQDADLAELNRFAPRLLAALRKLPQLKDVASDQQTGGLALELQIDRDTASRVGIPMQTIDSVLSDAYGQRQVATLYTQLNQYHVVLEATPELQQFPESLASIYAAGQVGSPVPLAALGSVAATTTSLSVNHQGQFPSVTLSFNLAPGASLGDAVAAINRAERQLGMPPALTASFTGTAEVFRESLASEPLLILTALLAVYIVLGILYESYIHPITILSTLPSAGMGALLALLLFHVELSIIALIGIVLLIGIVKKNAILMIDFALEAERTRGLSTRQSIEEAAVLRFRPILMTTLAALLGGLPLAFSHGMGGELRRPLGLTIVGGLLVSQLLTLFSTPVIYVALDRLARRFKRCRSSSTAPAR